MPVMRRVITVLLHVITGDDRRREPGVDDKYIYIYVRARDVWTGGARCETRYTCAVGWLVS